MSWLSPLEEGDSPEFNDTVSSADSKPGLIVKHSAVESSVLERNQVHQEDKQRWGSITRAISTQPQKESEQDSCHYQYLKETFDKWTYDLPRPPDTYLAHSGHSVPHIAHPWVMSVPCPTGLCRPYSWYRLSPWGVQSTCAKGLDLLPSTSDIVSGNGCA